MQAINLALKIINLLQALHERNIVHSNLNPDDIFLKEEGNVDSICFNSLFHCKWDP